MSVRSVKKTWDSTPLSHSVFKDKNDFEIALVLYAWLSNGWESEYTFAQKYISSTMQSSPYKFITDFYIDIHPHDSYTSFFRVLTVKNLKYLLNRLNMVYSCYGDLENCFFTILSQQRKSKYNHEIFASIFQDSTGFQTINSNCSFFRYNLLYYWLTEKFKIWDKKRHEKALLPCNDQIFKCAYDKNITKVLMKTNLPNTKTLTKKAKEIYGDFDFFVMYENFKEEFT